MTLFGVAPGLLAVSFVIAALVTALELITSKYPRTARFCVKSPWFHIYFVIYGLLGAGALALLPVLTQVTIEGVGLSNPWVKAAFVGLSIKAFLHIRIFSVSTGPGQSFPFGLESFVQLFEPWMLRTIELDHFSAQNNFIKPRAAKFATAVAAQAVAMANPPPALPSADQAAFGSDINQATSPVYVIAAYLKYAGVKLTENTFP
ncbi:MAG TPA: hypothetical protein VNZ48_01805 [Xanthobacteraceae bacterium]|jgi:hypothetical protein|nr:hypothetical protein [Xanthobacteraceae bacterium]